MESKTTKAFATRLPAREAEILEEVVEEVGLTRSALVRKAIRFYMAENPDHVMVLTPSDFTSRMLAEFE